MPSFVHALYFWFSLIFLISRTLAVSLYSAGIHDESKRPMQAFRAVPREAWNLEVRRFSDEVNDDTVALSGMKFFYLTRKLVLSVSRHLTTKKKKKKEEELNTPQLSALLSGGWYNCYIWIGSHSIPRGWRWLCAMLNNAMFVHFMWVLVVVVPQSNLIIFAAPTTNFNYSSSCSSFQLKWPNTAHRLTVRSARKTCNKNHEEENLFSFQNLFNIEI